MKKIAWLLAIVMMAGCFASCSDDSGSTSGGPGSGSQTPSGSSGSPEKTTVEPTQTSKKPGTTSKVTTKDSNLPTPSYPEEDVYDVPGGVAGDVALKGYAAMGEFVVSDDKKSMTSDSNSSLFVVTNDRMSAGKLTTTLTSLEGSTENDNGIVFGMEENLDEDSYYFWEDPASTPAYYILFVSDHNTLYLARVAYNGEPWHELAQSQVIMQYAHGETVTISVEFDGQGTMRCYANDNLLIEYTDNVGPRGSRYGVRADVAGVVYHNLIAEHAE